MITETDLCTFKSGINKSIYRSNSKEAMKNINKNVFANMQRVK